MAKVLRPVIIEGDLVYIPLPNGERVTCDLADLELINKNNWCYHDKATGGFIVAWNGHGVRALYLHRHLTKASPGEFVDFIDGDYYNYRRSNLKLVKRSSRQIVKANRQTKDTWSVATATPGAKWVPQYVIE